ncbi:hypothetical protein Dimus_026528 [Dionaea muscipula]
MASASALNPLHLQQAESPIMLLVSSSSSCKYPSTFTLFNFPISSHVSAFSSPKLILQPKFPPCAMEPNAIPLGTGALATAQHHNHLSEPTNFGTRDRITSGFCSSSSTYTTPGSKSAPSSDSRLVDDKSGKRFQTGKLGQNGSGSSSMSFNDDGSGGSLMDVGGREVVNWKVEGGFAEGGGIYGHEVRRKRRGKRSKESEVHLAKTAPLRIGLNRCSKMGDVMGAISLYDSAARDGIKMGQHQYTVLLYLCSSAAMGVIRRAESGSGSQKSDMLAPSTNGASLVSEDDDDDDNEEDYGDDVVVDVKDQLRERESDAIFVSEEVKKYALAKGLEIYKEMCSENVPLNEAALTSVARMAVAMGDGDMAFDMVKKMDELGINPRLRSYAPALSAFCSSGQIEKAFAVENHMLDHGVQPEEPELEALLRLSIEVGKADKVYYVLHKLRVIVRHVSSSTAELVEKWFKSRQASRVGKRRWDQKMIAKVMESVGGGWHGQGWLGSGKWTVARTSLGPEGSCKCCGGKLALIDLDPGETERFAQSVASIAKRREKYSSFEKFQEWLDYYGPFDAVIDAANVNAVASGIRRALQSTKWPLIVLHNRHLSGHKLNKPVNQALVDKWRNADALYATPFGSNDDWYWLYAAIKFKCLIVTNDEMRDHTFQLLGNDFFPKWKERHQVKFGFSDISPVFHMPPPYSVVIQESERGHWHFPVASPDASEGETTWLCITRPQSRIIEQESNTRLQERVDDVKDHAKSSSQTVLAAQDAFTSLSNVFSSVGLSSDDQSIVIDIDAAEKLGDCVIDFQI